MLGEQVGEERGKITGLRVLPAEGSVQKVEASIQGSGTFLGLETTDIATYVSVVRPDGLLHGDGQGILMTKDGEMASWRGEGRGRFTGRGTAASWRGAVYFQTASPQLARLNGVAVVFEYDVDENNNYHSKSWEWK